MSWKVQLSKQSIEREEELLFKMIELLTLEDQELVKKAIGERPKHPRAKCFSDGFGLRG